MYENYKIGVVIVNYHKDLELIQAIKMYDAIDSIDEICVVNNDVEEDNNGICQYKQISKKVYVFNQKENIGYSRGNNIGIAYLAGKRLDYIIISNSDVIITKYAIEECIKCFIECPDYGVIAPRMKDAYGFVCSPYVGDLSYGRLMYRLFVPEKKRDVNWEKKIEMDGILIPQSFVPGSFFVASTHALEASGGFDSNVFLYREEEILGKRMASAGYKLGLCSTVFFVHNHAYSNEPAKHKYKMLKLALKSEQYYFRRYKKANIFQMLYVKTLQFLYKIILFINWKRKEKVN